MTDMTITEFLEARIDEDEMAAAAYARFIDGALKGQKPKKGWDRPELRMPDPARLSAECAAKRAIVAEQFGYLEAMDGEWGDGCSAQQIRAGDCYNLGVQEMPILRHLAAVYAGHPDYRPEWARG
jgi:hypothetical protein